MLFCILLNLSFVLHFPVCKKFAASVAVTVAAIVISVDCWPCIIILCRDYNLSHWSSISYSVPICFKVWVFCHSEPMHRNLSVKIILCILFCSFHCWKIISYRVIEFMCMWIVCCSFRVYWFILFHWFYFHSFCFIEMKTFLCVIIMCVCWMIVFIVVYLTFHQWTFLNPFRQSTGNNINVLNILN